MDRIDRIVNESICIYLKEVYKVPEFGVLELGIGAVSKKRRYAGIIWDMIQHAYTYIGGCKSFDEYDGDGGYKDFLEGRYIWRIYFGEGKKIMGVMIYKATKFGRKRIVSCALNREIYNELLKSDLVKSHHVYGEVSGKSEHLLSKNDRVNWVNKEDVGTVLGRDKVVNLDRDEDVDKMERIPYDSRRHYYRSIGGSKHRKAMFGNPDLKTKNK